MEVPEQSVITQEEVMEIILNKPSNLKRMSSRLSEDSSLTNSSSKEDVDDSFKVVKPRKSKAKKKCLQSAAQGESHGLPDNQINIQSPNKNKDPTQKNMKDDIKDNSFWYDRQNKGPYIVFVRKMGQKTANKSISIIEASRLLTKANIKFLEIEFHAWNTWKITFDSYQEANNALKNKYLEELGLVLYIPKYKVFRKGIIKGIICDIQLNEIQVNLERENPFIRIANIFRKGGTRLPGVWLNLNQSVLNSGAKTYRKKLNYGRLTYLSHHTFLR